MPERPNILLIMTDQQRGDCLGVEGHPVLQTPNMDGIAAAGVRFARAYTTCPTCIAARRSLLSGQFPPTHGMVGYRDGVEWDAPVTLPQALRDAGYQTCVVGRHMHQHPPEKRYGYDHMVIHKHDYMDFVSRHVREPGDDFFFASGVMHNDWTVHPWHADERLHMNNWATHEALRFLQRRDPSCPFFLTLSYHSPHPPLQPPAFYLERYLRTGVPDPVIGDWAERPENDGIGLDPGSQRAVLEGERLLCARAAYYGLINHVDDQLRRVLNPITGVDRMTGGNTVVLFTSDHGEMLGDHYCWHKLLSLEPAARVPLLVRAPGRFGLQSGAVSDEPVCLEDVMPTLLELAGVPVPGTVEGRSLVPLLRGERPSWRDRLFIEHAPRHQSVTDGKEKYVWFVSDGRELFFDLREDPQETHDLSTDPAAAGRVALWRSRLVEHLKDRPEGFVDGSRLVPGRSYDPVLPTSGGAPS